ncbi:hypothetical protein OAE39_02590 [Akkermansiaceae bacterium]|nr:hypothetical protein [Akkermansiaceae bacterium]
MSENDENEADHQVPDGMVRKTRRVRKKRRSSDSSDSPGGKEEANRLFAKAKDLLVGMHDEDEDYGPVDVAEQLRRLKRKKEDVRPLDDVWGTKRRSTTWLWIVLVGVISAVVAAIIGLTVWTNQEDQESGPFIGWENPGSTQAPLENDALTWFYKDSVTVLEEAKKTIEMVNNGGGLVDIESIERKLRESSFRSGNAVDLKDWGSPLLTNSLSGFTWDARVVYSSEATGAKERGYISLLGKRKNGNPYELFFVRDKEDRLLLDWDASMGWSEMGVGELAEKKPRNEIFLRCKVGKEPGFDQMFGRNDYSGYVLTGEIFDDFIFAYVNLDKPGGKAIDRDFRLLLNYGSFVTDAPPLRDQKVTLRVKYDNEIGAEGQFEIVEYLNDGWVTP